MAAVESGDGEDVHEGEDDAEEGSHQPEGMPVPCGREDAADGAEAAEALGALARKYILEVGNVAAQGVPSVADASWDGSPEAVVVSPPLVGQCG